jgi:hypothetical protein
MRDFDCNSKKSDSLSDGLPDAIARFKNIFDIDAATATIDQINNQIFDYFSKNTRIDVNQYLSEKFGETIYFRDQEVRTLIFIQKKITRILYELLLKEVQTSVAITLEQYNLN